VSLQSQQVLYCMIRSMNWMRWLVPVSLAVLMATFLYRSEAFRNTFRYTLQGVALMPLLIAAICFQGSLAVRILNCQSSWRRLAEFGRSDLSSRALRASAVP